MIRKFRVLGVAFVAVFAMSAVVASAAQAYTSFTSEASPTTLQSEGTSEFQTLRVNSEVAAKCEEITLSSSTFTGLAVSEVTVTPSYHNAGGAKCNLEPFGEAEVKTNGCTYTFHAANSNVGITCSGSNKIEIKAPGCTVKVGTQSTSGASYANGSGDIDLSAEVPAAYTASGLLCGTFGVPSSGTATYTGTATVTGTHEGEPVKIGVE